MERRPKVRPSVLARQFLELPGPSNGFGEMLRVIDQNLPFGDNAVVECNQVHQSRFRELWQVVPQCLLDYIDPNAIVLGRNASGH